MIVYGVFGPCALFPLRFLSLICCLISVPSGGVSDQRAWWNGARWWLATWRAGKKVNLFKQIVISQPGLHDINLHMAQLNWRRTTETFGTSVSGPTFKRQFCYGGVCGTQTNVMLCKFPKEAKNESIKWIKLSSLIRTLETACRKDGTFLFILYFLKKLIILFSKDALNWSKMIVK